MFDNLSEKLGGILDSLTRRGALSEADVDVALREVRRALLEADVALDVARSFTEGVKKEAVGVEVMKSVTPGQMVVKIVHDQLVATLGANGQPIDLAAAPPVATVMPFSAVIGSSTLSNCNITGAFRGIFVALATGLLPIRFGPVVSGVKVVVK